MSPHRQRGTTVPSFLRIARRDVAFKLRHEDSKKWTPKAVAAWVLRVRRFGTGFQEDASTGGTAKTSQPDARLCIFHRGRAILVAEW